MFNLKNSLLIKKVEGNGLYFSITNPSVKWDQAILMKRVVI